MSLGDHAALLKFYSWYRKHLHEAGSKAGHGRETRAPGSQKEKAGKHHAFSGWHKSKIIWAWDEKEIRQLAREQAKKYFQPQVNQHGNWKTIYISGMEEGEEYSHLFYWKCPLPPSPSLHRVREAGPLGTFTSIRTTDCKWE